MGIILSSYNNTSETIAVNSNEKIISNEMKNFEITSNEEKIEVIIIDPNVKIKEMIIVDPNMEIKEEKNNNLNETTKKSEALITESNDEIIKIITINSTEQQNKIITSSHYIHPLIELINNNAMDEEILECLKSFLQPDEGEYVYQYELLSHIIQLFHHCTIYRKDVSFNWIFNNYTPLQVSYDNNMTLRYCILDGYNHLKFRLISHPSFEPNKDILYFLLIKNELDMFRKCLENPNLDDKIKNNREQIEKYLDENMIDDLIKLLN